MNATKTIQFRADVLEGNILRFPKTFNLQCGKIQILGMQTFKDLDDNLCTISMKCLSIMYSGQLMGNREYTVESFISYRNTNCSNCCIEEECGLTINGCLITIGGCLLEV